MCSTIRISDEEKFERIERLNQVLNSLNIRFEVGIITPELAAEWLKKNTKNRDVDGRKYSYARQMIEEAWGFSGQPIIFSDTDVLLDGGGRLTGVVTSNSPILSTIIYGVPEDSFKCIDCGKIRTAKDTLAASKILANETKTIQGYVASMAKRISEWGSNRYGSHGSASSRSNVAGSIEIQNFIEENVTMLRDCAKSAASMMGAHREKLLSKKDYFGSMMAYLTIFKSWDFSDVYPFFNELTDARSTVRGEGNPIATLRTYLQRAYSKDIYITDEERFHMFSRAWNEYLKNGCVKRFSLKSCNDVPMSKEEYIEYKKHI
jgi:hypothetical protein